MSAPEAAAVVAPVEEVKPVEATPAPAVEVEAPKVEEAPAPVPVRLYFLSPYFIPDLCFSSTRLLKLLLPRLRPLLSRPMLLLPLRRPRKRANLYVIL